MYGSLAVLIATVLLVVAASITIKDYLALPVYGISNATGECVYELDKGQKVSCPEVLADKYLMERVL